MTHIYELWHNDVCFGRYTKEQWANTAAALFMQSGLEMELECHPFIVSTQKEAEEAFRRIKQNYPPKNQ